jgi:hypothetical protein
MIDYTLASEGILRHVVDFKIGVEVINTHMPLLIHDKWVPVTTAWRVLRLRMEEWPPDMEGSFEYIE